MIRTNAEYRRMAVMEAIRVQPDLIHEAMTVAGMPAIDATATEVVPMDGADMSDDFNAEAIQTTTMTTKINRSQAGLLAEYTKRRNMAISVYRPQPHQEPIYKQYAREYLIRGGVRCSVAGTEVWKCERPNKQGAKAINYTTCKIEDLRVGDMIVGVKEGMKRRDQCPVVVEEIHEFEEESLTLETKRGYTLSGTHDHPVWACPPLPPRYNNSVDPDRKNGQWVYLCNLKPGWYVCMAYGSHVDWEGEVDEEAYLHGLMDGDGSCECYDYGIMKLAGHVDESLVGWTGDYLNSKGIHNREYRKRTGGLGVNLEWCNKPFKEKYLAWENPGTPEYVAGYIRGLFDAYAHFSPEGKIQLTQVNEERIRHVHRLLLLFGIRSSLMWADPPEDKVNWSRKYRLQISGCSVKRYAKSIGSNEAGKAVMLEKIASERRNPGTTRQWWDRVESVTKSEDKKRIIAISTSGGTYVSNGIVSHNSGKSLNSSMLFGSIAMDIPITFEDGTQMEMRKPWQKVDV